jgi:LPXTG-motif cell wall-anchored protein
VPFNSVLFDRLIAYTRVTGTAVFAIYLADALGYTGSIGVQLYKDLFQSDATRLDFFRHYSYFMAALGLLLLVGAGFYFLRRPTHPHAQTTTQSN